MTQIGYSIASTSIPQRTRFEEDQLPIRNEGCRSQFLLHPAPTSKVCLFFHGFTAGPYQFLPMARVFHRAGYNVVIPRLPGHGQAGDWNRNSPPPLPKDIDTYKQFALHWLHQAQALGDKVVVGGLSAGGTMAGWLGLEQPQNVDRALLFAPYLSGSNKVLDLFVRYSNDYAEWESDPNQQPIGYGGFLIENLRVFLTLGAEVLKRARSVPTAAPTFIVSTDADRAVRNLEHRDLFETLLPKQPKTWCYSFDRVLNIPHTMMTKAEGNAWENLLNVMVKAFMQSDLTWAEVEEIAYRMTQGKTFNQVIAELGLAGKASPDMPALMTMIDKREIVIKRNPSYPNDPNS